MTTASGIRELPKLNIKRENPPTFFSILRTLSPFNLLTFDIVIHIDIAAQDRLGPIIAPAHDATSTQLEQYWYHTLAARMRHICWQQRPPIPPEKLVLLARFVVGGFLGLMRYKDIQGS